MGVSDKWGEEMSDLIRREDAIKAYNEAMDELVKWQMEEWQLGDFSECEFNTTDCKHIVRKLEAIPTIDAVSVVHGEWIEHKERTIVRNNNFIDFFPTEYECSNCGLRRATYSIGSLLINFCPNCGAKMDGEREGER